MFEAAKHGNYAALCRMPIRLIDAIDKVEQIHKTNIIMIDWSTDGNYELQIDGSENIE